MGNIPFLIQTYKTHTWESCTNLTNGILPLMVFNIQMHGIFKNPYMIAKNPLMCYVKSHYCFVLHINGIIFKMGIKLFSVFSHLCNPPTNGFH